MEISSRFVDNLVDIDPVTATQIGVRGHDDRWTDYSPEGFDGRADLARRTRREVEPHLGDPDGWESHAARVLHARLGESLASFEMGDHLRAVSHLVGPFQTVRDIFDVMPRDDADGWRAVARRLSTMREPLLGLRSSLEEGRSRGLVAARRQVESVIRQARDLDRPDSAWGRLESEVSRVGDADLAAEVTRGVGAAREAAGEFGDYLATTYLASADDADGVGRDRYLASVDRFLGLALEPEEVYAWGWDEIDRLLGEMRRVAAEIEPGGDIGSVTRLLETDPARAVHSREDFARFIAIRQESALAELDGDHFDVDPRIREVTVNFVPSGAALGAHYLSPSEDFGRPGGIWYSIPPEQVQIPLYQEVSTAYHEGFPGHHLQIGTALALGDRLSRAHRLLVWYPGYGEGWGLYTERLMDELGYFEKPDYVFGMLASHIFRAARVVVDIGCHLGLPVPSGAPEVDGEVWSFETATRFMSTVGMQPSDYARSDVLRYLGWPGQAISYKVGEREILALRDEKQRSDGASFDLKAFHATVLGHGPVRLDMLRQLVVGG